jgi:hypothetical protein
MMMMGHRKANLSRQYIPLFIPSLLRLFISPLKVNILSSISFLSLGLFSRKTNQRKHKSLEPIYYHETS